MGLARLETLRRLEGEHAERSLDGDRQRSVLDINHLFLAELGLYIHQSILVNVNLELQGGRQGIKEFLGCHNLDRRTVVVVTLGLEPALVLDIRAVELELLNHLCAQFL